MNSTTARYRNVAVMRLQETNYVRYAVDLEDLLPGRDKQPFYLLPLDIVYVPARLYSP